MIGDNPVPSFVEGAPALFRATTAVFDRDLHQRTIDELAEWVTSTFRSDLAERCSKHVYVSTLPDDRIAGVDRLRDDPLVYDTIRRQFPTAVEIVPMKDTDELYLSHYNKDLGGDHGLFAKHYDGNLRFVPVAAVVRALIYVRSEGTYRVVFADSGIERQFATYDLALLDFHRELHWVEGAYDPNAGDRIVLKCNYLVVPAGQPLLRRALLALNLGQFYVVKAAMEYSKSPRNLAQRAVGLVCNGVRLLNNVHPLLPHAAFVAVPTAIAGLLWVVT